MVYVFFFLLLVDPLLALKGRDVAAHTAASCLFFLTYTKPVLKLY